MNTTAIARNSLLIAEPFLGDANFERSVVLICEHTDDDGSFGLILNQTTTLHVSDVIDDVYADIPLFVGGPVQPDTLHYLHRRPDLIDNSIRLGEGLYWSGDFGQVKQALNIGTLTEADARFFIGYSGWEAGQLHRELDEKAWIMTRTNSGSDANFLFDTPPDQLWRGILKRMGGQYKVLSNYPVDPRLN
jgi:putative transcriptional regulator